MITLVAAVMAQSVASPPAPPVSAAGTYRLHLIDYEAGQVRCDGRTVAPLITVDPKTHVARSNGTPPSGVNVRFTLDIEGRPAGIATALEGGRQIGVAPYDDLAPAISLWRFPAARSGAACEVSFSPRLIPVDDAPPLDVLRVATLGVPNTASNRSFFDRVRQIDCGGKRPPQMLVRAYPDKRDLPRRMGEPGYSIVRFDIDAAGVPVHPEIAASSGNAALDAAALDAVSRTRYAGGDPRVGCTVPTMIGADIAPVAPGPRAAELRPAGSTCPYHIDWAQPFGRSYPDAFRRRAVEGWAILAFDITGSGQPGNVRVLASEPAAAFGEQAGHMLRMGRAKVAPGGVTGCAAKFLFRMADRRGTD